MNTPKIRFKGFKDDWEQRKLGEVAEYRNGKAHENEIDEDGEYIVVNSKFVSTNAEIRKFSNAQNEPLYENEIAFVLSDVPNGRAIARTFLVDKSGKYTLNQRIAGITPHEDTDPYYLHIRMNRNAYFLKFDDGNKQTNLSIKDVLNYEDMYPSYKEQQKIGSYFGKLDHLITLHQRKCDETKQLKKFMLQKMFPKNGEKNPEIRFEGFTDDWEQRKFGELFSRRMERNLGQFDNTRWISVARMYFQDPDRVTSNNIDTRTYVMREGDIAFEGHSNQEYRYGRFVANDIGDGVISELFPIYQHIVPYNNYYWKYAIQIETIMAPKILRCIEISYTSSNKLDEKFFLEESTSVPGIEEQRKIGALLSNLDNLITLHQRKCEKLKELKKFMLQNMFV